jgi:hypothetical protein
MMHRITNTSATAIELQNAAEARRAQAASAQSAQQTGAQYNFAEIFGRNDWGQTETAAASASTTVSSHGGFDTAIATATAKVIVDEGALQGPTPTSTTAAATATSATTATAATETTATTTPAPVTTTGVQALVTAIMNGSFQPTYVTNPSQLQETTPAGTDSMPNFYYASDQTAAQLAQVLGGTVVKMPPFGQDRGWSEPDANFIQLPNGQTFNAADIAYYANCGPEGASQLTADITGAINEGSAMTTYYQQGGAIPTFAEGYVGPPITGSTYSASMIGAGGNVINPAFQQSTVSGT